MTAAVASGRPAGAAAPGLVVADGAVRVLAWHLDDDRDIALAEAWETLAPAEAARARRFRFPRDRDRFVRGRGGLRRELGLATGLPAASVPIVEGPRGRPGLAGGRAEFNLAHSGPIAVLALSAAGPVGIDVELLDRSVDIDGLAPACFTDAERAVLARLPPGPRRARFFAFWTAKEARMKLTGEGMALEPRAIALALDAGGRPAGCAAPRAPRVRFHWPDLGVTGAICCVATLAGMEPGP